jgi:hypothetical protein
MLLQGQLQSELAERRVVNEALTKCGKGFEHGFDIGVLSLGYYSEKLDSSQIMW